MFEANKKILDLSDATIRAFKKKDGRISFHLKSFIFVNTTVNFSLTDYLRDFHCSFTLPNDYTIEFDKTAIGVRYFFPHEFNILAHTFHASTISDLRELEDCLAKLNIVYRISFTGHPSEGSETLQKIVPVVTFFKEYRRLT
jgi:hypothetical protein